ncbi:hypothetical protein GJ496_006402 [Pomphorhynchus laevis]|nr:hypothetical protein GJ496_006402 [Pomphorhynchus laevis]
MDNFNFGGSDLHDWMSKTLECIVNSHLFIETFCYNDEIKVAPLYAMALWATSELTGLHFPLDAFYGASWNDSWGSRNYAREPIFRTEYQDRIPYYHNCMALSFLYKKMAFLLGLNNEGNFQWRLWQGTKEYDNNRSHEAVYLKVNYSMFALNAFLQESGLAVDYRPWCRRPEALDKTHTTFRAIHMTAPRVIDNWGVYPVSIRTYLWRHHYEIALCIELAANEVNV